METINTTAFIYVGTKKVYFKKVEGEFYNKIDVNTIPISEKSAK
jgi:hypothetical protein